MKRSSSAGRAHPCWVPFAPISALVLAVATIPGRPVPAEAQATAVENPHGSFQADCATCHAPDSWTPARIASDFDHARYGYELDGAHAATPCLLCHLDLAFSTVTGATCAECHQDVHAGELGAECDRCHSTRSFIDRTDDIRTHRLTRFPLTGAHATVDCASCHGPSGTAAMRFVNTPTDCFACHRGDYGATTNPDHTAASFPKDCAQCHSAFAWSGSQFDHALTGFRLTGAHRVVDCEACHTGFQFAGTSSDCFSCHASDYQAAVPDHPASGFGTNCAQCHGTTTWAGAAFDHSTTAFPLTGAHKAVDCLQCHGDGVYTGTSSDCFSCHSSDYQTAVPDHPASGFGTACAQCHGTATWSDAVFDHSATAFPLTGAHTATSCLECHGDGVYAGKDPACAACHLADYQATATPNHLSSGFSTDCASCHGTATWLGATFDHDARFFPIYSGKHRGKWGTDCTTCHTQPASYTVFTCFQCHEHNRTKANDQHKDISGYSYDSNACYSCHPRGKS